MLIAIASDDGVQVAAHTGRCRGFVVYEVEGREARQVAFREKSSAGHGHGDCGDGHGHAGGGCHGHHESESSSRCGHQFMQECLHDCQVLVARGMGPGLIAGLKAVGIDPYVCRVAEADAAARQYAEGNLARVVGTGAACQH